MQKAYLFLFLFLIIGCGSEYNEAPSYVDTVHPNIENGLLNATVTIPNGAQSLGSAAFGQSPLAIPMGTTVHWVNNDTVAHSVTATNGAWDSGSIQPNGTFSYTFMTAGSFSYHCADHPSMVGVVQVN